MKPVPADVRSDLQAVIHHVASGAPVDDALLKRVAERSRKAQDDLLQKHGIREIAVDFIREVRNEE